MRPLLRGEAGASSGTRDRASRGTARPAHLPGVARHPAGLGEGAAEKELDLGVGAAHLVGRPLRQGVVDGRVEP